MGKGWTVLAEQGGVIETEGKVGVPGVFTPVGEVICLNCHGEFLKWNYGKAGKQRMGDWNMRDTKRLPRDGEGVTLCRNCRVAICVRKDVADISEFGWAVDDSDDPVLLGKVGGAQVEQSGGMCCGMRLDFIGPVGHPTGRFVYVSDGTMCGTEALAMGLYRSDEAFENGEPADFIEFTKHEDGLAKLKSWARRS